MPIFLLILFGAILAHLMAITITGQFIGVKVRMFSLGFGPAIFHANKFRLGAIPTGGYVKFRDSTQEIVPPDEINTALDGRSTFEQLIISLSGCAVLLIFSISSNGVDGLNSFLNLPWQFFTGAISPLGDAQAFIRQGLVFLHSASFWILASIICAKLAALNLIPFPTMNGGAALAIMARRIGLAKCWHPSLTLLLTLIYLVFFASWCLALVVYASSN